MEDQQARCGIAGLLTLKPTTREELNKTITSLTDTLYHRCPDDSGIWVDEARRPRSRFPAAVDRRPQRGGHQPMISADGATSSSSMERRTTSSLSAGARVERSSVPRSLRYGSDAGRVRRIRHRAALQRSMGCVAFALWDRRREPSISAAATAWKEAAVLRVDRSDLRFRVRTEGIRDIPTSELKLMKTRSPVSCALDMSRALEYSKGISKLPRPRC